MNLPTRTGAALIIAGVALSTVVQASKRKPIVQQAVDAYQSTSSYTVPAAGTVEVAFSPASSRLESCCRRASHSCTQPGD